MKCIRNRGKVNDFRDVQYLKDANCNEEGGEKIPKCGPGQWIPSKYKQVMIINSWTKDTDWSGSCENKAEVELIQQWEFWVFVDTFEAIARDTCEAVCALLSTWGSNKTNRWMHVSYEKGRVTNTRKQNSANVKQRAWGIHMIRTEVLMQFIVEMKMFVVIISSHKI